MANQNGGPAPDRPRHSGRGNSPRRRARDARVLAFEVLYEVDIARHAAAGVFERRIAEEGVTAEEAEAPRALVRGVLQARQELDAIIQTHAPSWPIEQLSAVERNILRLALYELRYQREHVPVGVAINEAVELAKMFGGDAASRFVNGVLGQFVRSEDAPTDSPDEPESPGGET
jgi:transcription antitermination protein NusB